MKIETFLRTNTEISMIVPAGSKIENGEITVKGLTFEKPFGGDGSKVKMITSYVIKGSIGAHEVTEASFIAEMVESLTIGGKELPVALLYQSLEESAVKAIEARAKADQERAAAKEEKLTPPVTPPSDE